MTKLASEISTIIPQSVSMPMAYENPLNLDVVGSASSVLKSSSFVVDSFRGVVLEPKVVVVILVVLESVVLLDAIVVVDMVVMSVLVLVPVLAVAVLVGSVTPVV